MFTDHHRPLRRLGLLTAALAVATLAACGGHDDAAPAPGAAPAPAPAPAPTPPPAPAAPAATSVTGAVVKGPLAGAQVCAYAVAGSARGAALGSCTTSDASGHYTLSVPVGSGLVWVEASGGSYVDEATLATVALPAGSAMAALVAANGSSVTSVLTPLTTLALNAARTTAGSAGTLSTAAYAAAAAQLLSTFSLPATLDLTTTLPAFGSSANAYGNALTNVSRMVAAGLPLAQLLATTQPSQLQAAYAAAAAAGNAPPPAAPAAAASASGSVTVAGGRTDFAPQADGFEVRVKASETSYRFFRRSTPAGSTAIHTEEINVNVARGSAITVTYADSAAGFTQHFCFSSCGVTISTPSGATHPVTVAFNATALANGRTLNGSVVGDVGGAAWTLADLPRTTTGSVSVNGVAQAAIITSESTITSGSITQRTATILLADDSQLAVSAQGSTAPGVTRAVPPATGQFCLSSCGATITDGSNGTTVAFNATPLSGGVVLQGSVFIGKTSGSVSSPELGTFTPVADGTTSFNSERTITFSTLGTGSTGISTLNITHRAGRVTTASVTVGIGAQAYSCFEVAAVGIPACSGITVAADGRTVTLAGAVLNGGAAGAPRTNVTISGTVVAKGQ